MGKEQGTIPKNSSTDISEAVSDIVATLSPLTEEAQVRALNAVVAITDASLNGVSSNGSADSSDQTEEGKYSQKVQNWLDKHDISREDLRCVFFKDGEIIAEEMPGSTNSKETRNCYVLTGLSDFIATGEGSFEDSRARSVCDDFGCYDPSNHTAYVKNTKYFSGSKKGGWSLTKPGLKKGAKLVKEIVEKAQ